MSGLPQELIDHIIDYVSDRDTLKACSLVCSQWSSRSRKRLFVRTGLFFKKDLQRWCASIRPGPSGPSSLVEDLSLTDYRILATGSQLQSSVLSNATSHLQSFSGLRVLRIWGWDMSADNVSRMVHCLSSSSGNVTCLTLGHVFVHPSTLAMFVSHFPHLNDLSISLIDLRDGTDDPHRGSRVDIVPTYPCGEFSASCVSSWQEPKVVFESITLLKPRFRQVNLENVSDNTWRDYWPLVEACGGSLEELRILAAATVADCDGLSLACCPNLRTITLSFGHDQPIRLSQFIKKCLSTITSTQLSKVSLRVLRVIPYFGPPGANLPLWDSLDIILYNLAGKYQLRPEGEEMLVELTEVNSIPSESQGFLQRYRERGILRVNSATRAEPSECLGIRCHDRFLPFMMYFHRIRGIYQRLSMPRALQECISVDHDA